MRSSSPLFLWIVYNLWKMFLISLTTLIENPSGSGPLVACKSMATAPCNWLASVQRSAWSAIFWSRLTCSSRYEIPPWELGTVSFCFNHWVNCPWLFFSSFTMIFQSGICCIRSIAQVPKHHVCALLHEHMGPLLTGEDSMSQYVAQILQTP